MELFWKPPGVPERCLWLKMALENYGNSRKSSGNPRKSYGIPWNSMEILRNSIMVWILRPSGGGGVHCNAPEGLSVTSGVDLNRILRDYFRRVWGIFSKDLEGIM